jgi:TolB-like protein
MASETESTLPGATEPSSTDPLTGNQQLDKKRKKKKDKVRSAWISFIGRIVAQIMGAVATIGLGLLVVHKYQSPNSAKNQAALQTPPAQTAPIRAVTPGELSLAVLPLETYSKDTEGSFADSMTEELITGLARLEGVRVLSRTSSMTYKHDRRRMPEIGRELGVNYLLEGSVTKADGRVRITAQLIDARSDEHLWADSYERPLREILTVQSSVAASIARSVREALTGARKPRAIVVKDVDPRQRPAAAE